MQLIWLIKQISDEKPDLWDGRWFLLKSFDTIRVNELLFFSLEGNTGEGQCLIFFDSSLSAISVSNSPFCLIFQLCRLPPICSLLPLPSCCPPTRPAVFISLLFYHPPLKPAASHGYCWCRFIDPPVCSTKYQNNYGRCLLWIYRVPGSNHPSHSEI